MSNIYFRPVYSNELYHHGIRGQKWGVRNGPPYPLKGGKYAVTKKKKLRSESNRHNSSYNKRHYDKTINKGATLSTLSWNPDRTKDTDMFFATYDKLDKQQYRAMFNKKTETELFDQYGNKVGTGKFYKYNIDNKIVKDVKVASEDSSVEGFKKMYEKDRDFYNYVTDPSRMESQFVKGKYVFKGYREAKKALDKIRNDENVTDKDLAKVYRMFNYTIPSDGQGDAKIAKDVATQRAKFFKVMKDAGYGAILDTNDALYGGFHATAPVIMFDMEAFVPDRVRRTNITDKAYATLVTRGRKLLGV